MRADRFEMLKELIEAGTWDIDLSTGIVVGKFGSTGATGKGGYLRMVSHGAIYMVHEIVAVAGGLNPVNATIDHINNDCLDNRLCNLQILSIGENASKGWHSHKDRTQGSKNGQSKLTEKDVIEIKMKLAKGELQYKLAEEYGISKETVSAISRGRRWGWL